MGGGEIFMFYATNYAMVIIPSQAAGDKLLYIRHYRAETEGDESQVCRKQVLD